MTRANGPNYVAIASLSAVLSAAAAAPSTQSRAQEDQTDKSACEEVNKHYLVEREQLNTRTLTDLLFEATQKDCAALVEQFLAEGASVKVRTGIGNTALIVAARMGHTTSSNCCWRGAEIDQRN
jgi:ankyrin repeat protein